jgi:hypothetical protein
MNAEVECYAGSSYPESPRALTWEGQCYIVEEIISQRREPHGIGFIVRCEPENTVFDLFYLTEEEQWQIIPSGSAIDYLQSLKPQK